jgi:hypothetical protein
MAAVDARGVRMRSGGTAYAALVVEGDATADGGGRATLFAVVDWPPHAALESANTPSNLNVCTRRGAYP